MTEVFKGINKEFMENIVEGMEEDGENYLDIPFNEFKKLIKSETKAKSIRTINQSVTIQMNKVGPPEWVFKVGSRKNGDIVHISMTKK